jgi:nucleoid DNA-binding protein
MASNEVLARVPAIAYGYAHSLPEGGLHHCVSTQGNTVTATKNPKMTKTQVIAALSEETELSKQDVARVFEALSALIAEQLAGRGGPGEVVIPGLLKLKAVKKPATKEREGINPFTKEPITIAAKPASKKVKAIPLKALKEMVE